MPQITAVSLSKKYAQTPVLHDVSFACGAGEIVGLLGPNGAGKTTTMRILTGYLPPTSGRAAIAGHDTLRDSLQARAKLGYLPENVPLYPEMSVTSYLHFIGRLRRVPHLGERVRTVLQSVDLTTRAESLIGSLSKGLRQRVGLAQALLHDPPVLILDEPTIGLDPRQITEVRGLIKRLGEERTVLLSTHILSEVEQICDRAIILIHGRVRADFPLQQNFEEQQRVRVRCAHLPADALAQIEAGLAENITAVSLHRPTRSFELSLSETGDPTAVAAFVLGQGWGLQELTPLRTDLESLFLQKLREAEGDMGRMGDDHPLP